MILHPSHADANYRWKMLTKFKPYLPYIKPIKWLFLTGIVMGVIAGAASSIGVPMLMKEVFPALFKGENYQELWITQKAIELYGNSYLSYLLNLCILFILLNFFIRSFSTYLSKLFLKSTGLKVSELIRTDVYTKLQSLPISFYDKHKSGDLLARLNGDAEALRRALITILSDLIIQPAQLIFAIGAIIWLSWQSQSSLFALIALLSIPLCVFPIRLIGKKVKKRSIESTKLAGDFSALMIESMQSPREVRAYNLESKQIKSFKTMVAEMIRLSLKTIKYNLAVAPSVEFVAISGLSLSLYIGVSNGMTWDDFFALAMALYFGYEPVKKLGAINATLKAAEASLERLEVILHAESDVPEASNPTPLPSIISGTLTFQDTYFRYQSAEEDNLKGLNLTIKPGETVALVGESGAGKSSFINLIPRFYDPTRGSILLDDINVTDLSTHDLRAQIAIVPQLPLLFSGTIAENILIGKPEASQEEVEEAAKKAFAHDFILQQDNGYHTSVSEKGLSLSGGQRQRIAIARAFLKDAPILLLDEATSALDNQSEAKIQASLEELTKGRTTLTIAHRFSSLKNATRFLVFEQGKIIADGTHEELIKTNSVYQNLYEKSKPS